MCIINYGCPHRDIMVPPPLSVLLAQHSYCINIDDKLTMTTICYLKFCGHSRS